MDDDWYKGKVFKKRPKKRVESDPKDSPMEKCVVCGKEFHRLEGEYLVVSPEGYRCPECCKKHFGSLEIDYSD
ncbi:MAG: hypothetical protein BAJATHORv1_10383 [Candidatus Thorarchaeota archaeon]|nr:MAG: hypothetical protein BAJATHORv1_10383 [Candidatus Thorarchaeota archaeon]